MDEPAKMLRDYDEGRITRHELLIRLCQAAVDRPPGEIAAALPPDVLAEVRERSAAPPRSPGRCRLFHAGGWIWDGNLNIDRDAYFRQESRRLYDGLWRWHRYFSGA